MARQFIYNAIPQQTKTHANQLTMRAWNDYINILRLQTNDSSTYIETLNKWLFADSSLEDKFYEGGFVSYIIKTLNTKADTVYVEECVANTLDQRLENLIVFYDYTKQEEE